MVTNGCHSTSAYALYNFLVHFISLRINIKRNINIIIRQIIFFKPDGNNRGNKKHIYNFRRLLIVLKQIVGYA